jgi:vitamin B12 transporter
MKKSTIASLIGLALTTPFLISTAIAAEKTKENIDLDDVVVTATRTPQPREVVIADVTVIEAEQIQNAGQSSLVELLQLQPGVEISNNGGAGKLSNVFMRGTNSGQVVVLIDGMRVNSATSGTASFENLPLNQVERIEILRGPATSLYGQDAIGGVIQLFTKKGTGKPKFYASAGYGTYNTRELEAGVRGSVENTSFSVNVSATNTDGFSAVDSKKATIKDDDAYRNLAFTASLNQTLAEGHDIGVRFFNSDGVVRYDNAFNLTDFSTKTKLQQQSLSLYSKNQFFDFWNSQFKVGYSKDKRREFDETNEFNPNRINNFDTELTQISWQNDFKLHLGTLTLLYDRLEEDLDSTVAYDKTNRINEGYVASYLANIGSHSVQASLREDHNSAFGSQVTGGVGYGFSINPNWRITGSYGSAFKAPTFNDLYYPFFNNPNLQPEKSDNLEASLRFQQNETQLSATVFENRIRNLIAFDSTTFAIDNLEKARIQGLTLAGAQGFGNFNLQGSIDFQSPRDRTSDNLLPRRANRHAKLNLNYDLGNWQLGAEFLATSTRYNDKANKVPLAGYGLLNLNANYKISSDWQLQARLNNALDKNYTLANDFGGEAYNTPGANLFVNIRYQP